MIRGIAASLLFVTTGAFAQSGGVIMTTGAIDSVSTGGSLTFIESPTLDTSSFQNVLVESTTSLIVIKPMDSIVGVAAQGAIPSAHALAASIGESPLIAIDGEGMRLPEQRSDAVRRPLMPFDPHRP